MTPITLERILAPITPQEFYAEYYDRAFLHVPRVNDQYWDFLAQPQVIQDEIWSGRLQYPRLEIKDSGRSLDPASLLDARGEYDMDLLNAEEKRGATFHLLGLESWYGNILDLKTLLSNASGGAHVFVNAYWTPARTLGRAHSLHWDPVDSWIIQLHGEKIWTLYESPQMFSKNYYAGVKAGAEITRLTLRPGSLLYVPRGMLHAVDTETYSLHLVAGVEGIDLIDVLTMVTRTMYNSDEALRHLIPREAKQNPSVLRGAMKQLLDDIEARWESLYPGVNYEPRFGQFPDPH